MTKQGFAKIAGIYLANYMSIALRGKPANSAYEDIR